MPEYTESPALYPMLGEAVDQNLMNHGRARISTTVIKSSATSSTPGEAGWKKNVSSRALLVLGFVGLTVVTLFTILYVWIVPIRETVPVLAKQVSSLEHRVESTDNSVDEAKAQLLALVSQVSSLEELRGRVETLQNIITMQDNCKNNPCLNEGVCVDGADSFLCICPAGIIGNTCQTDVDECSSNPCKNGATCEDRINWYSCQCAPGYTGVNCEIDIDDCSPNPCKSGETCVDGVDTHTCICGPGNTDDERCARRATSSGQTLFVGENSVWCFTSYLLSFCVLLI